MVPWSFARGLRRPPDDRPRESAPRTEVAPLCGAPGIGDEVITDVESFCLVSLVRGVRQVGLRPPTPSGHLPALYPLAQSVKELIPCPLRFPPTFPPTLPTSWRIPPPSPPYPIRPNHTYPAPSNGLLGEAVGVILLDHPDGLILLPSSVHFADLCPESDDTAILMGIHDDLRRNAADLDRWLPAPALRVPTR